VRRFSADLVSQLSGASAMKLAPILFLSDRLYQTLRSETNSFPEYVLVSRWHTRNEKYFDESATL
jgi:hypothetical protein